jgi:hypothetical protein
MKQNSRRLYDLGEMFIGACACWVGLASVNSSQLSAALTLCSGLYIIVRGLDNYYQGMLLAERRREQEKHESEGSVG